MAIPDYQTLMLPVLKVAADGQEHRIGDVIKQLARDFGLTEAEQQQMLPSGRQTAFANRVGWAKTYLVQAGLLEATKRAHFKITNRGQKALTEGPPRIDMDRKYRTRRPIRSTDSGTNAGPITWVKMPSGKWLCVATHGSIINSDVSDRTR
jgi:restriction endonuclease Mrr